MTIQQKIQQLQKIQVSQIASKVVSNNTDLLTAELRDQLERRHESGKGDAIGYYVSTAYVKWKSKQSTISPFFSGYSVDLFLTGEWQSSITAEVRGDEYVLDSTNYITKFLTKRYGIEILEFSDTSKNNLKLILTPLVAEQLKKEMT